MALNGVVSAAIIVRTTVIIRDRFQLGRRSSEYPFFLVIFQYRTNRKQLRTLSLPVKGIYKARMNIHESFNFPFALKRTINSLYS